MYIFGQYHFSNTRWATLSASEKFLIGEANPYRQDRQRFHRHVQNVQYDYENRIHMIKMTHFINKFLCIVKSCEILCESKFIIYLMNWLVNFRGILSVAICHVISQTKCVKNNNFSSISAWFKERLATDDTKSPSSPVTSTNPSTFNGPHYVNRWRSLLSLICFFSSLYFHIPSGETSQFMWRSAHKCARVATFEKHSLHLIRGDASNSTKEPKAH